VAQQRDASSVQRTTVQNILFRPLQWLSPLLTPTIQDWLQLHTAQRSFLQVPLPLNLHLLTVKAMNTTSLLLRVAHIFAVGEDPIWSNNATISLGSLFTNINVTQAVETTVTGNQLLTDVQARRARLARAATAARFQQSFEETPVPPGVTAPVNVDALTVTISAMQVRTFICRFVRVADG
jgi:hypothetical protein